MLKLVGLADFTSSTGLLYIENNNRVSRSSIESESEFLPWVQILLIRESCLQSQILCIWMPSDLEKENQNGGL